MKDLATIAEIMDEAACSGTAIAQLSQSGQALTLEEAYAVQRLSVARRLARGETLAGIKMGFTSRAKMAQMGIDEMIWGHLTSAMLLEDGAGLNLGAYVHPRVEPEIAFLLKRSLCGRVTLAQALAAVEAVAPAIEIIDSRYRDFKFNLADVVADNSSSASFVLGPWHRPDGDLTNRGMILAFDNRTVETGSSAAILGNPVRALAAASRLVAQHGMVLRRGWIVLAGGATAAATLQPGIAVANIVEGLDRASFHVAR
ncbi:MAG: 4-oxalocrotonate decarboxylase [Alphaproteobacteria bacterium]|nr:MAG: 4-oxalocrotonate decarboxylase [Alphaproteobacteria bacterium]